MMQNDDQFKGNDTYSPVSKQGRLSVDLIEKVPYLCVKGKTKGTWDTRFEPTGWFSYRNFDLTDFSNLIASKWFAKFCLYSDWKMEIPSEDRLLNLEFNSFKVKTFTTPAIIKKIKAQEKNVVINGTIINWDLIERKGNKGLWAEEIKATLDRNTPMICESILRAICIPHQIAFETRKLSNVIKAVKRIFPLQDKDCLGLIMEFAFGDLGRVQAGEMFGEGEVVIIKKRKLKVVKKIEA